MGIVVLMAAIVSQPMADEAIVITFTGLTFLPQVQAVESLPPGHYQVQAPCGNTRALLHLAWQTSEETFDLAAEACDNRFISLNRASMLGLTLQPLDHLGGQSLTVSLVPQDSNPEADRDACIQKRVTFNEPVEGLIERNRHLCLKLPEGASYPQLLEIVVVDADGTLEVLAPNYERVGDDEPRPTWLAVEPQNEANPGIVIYARSVWSHVKLRFRGVAQTISSYSIEFRPITWDAQIEGRKVLTLGDAFIFSAVAASRSVAVGIFGFGGGLAGSASSVGVTLALSMFGTYGQIFQDSFTLLLEVDQLASYVLGHDFGRNAIDSFLTYRSAFKFGAGVEGWIWGLQFDFSVQSADPYRELSYNSLFSGAFVPICTYCRMAVGIYGLMGWGIIKLGDDPLADRGFSFVSAMSVGISSLGVELSFTMQDFHASFHYSHHSLQRPNTANGVILERYHRILGKLVWRLPVVAFRFDLQYELYELGGALPNLSVSLSAVLDAFRFFEESS